MPVSFAMVFKVMVRGTLLSIAAAIVTLSGCQEPVVIVAAPPGVDPPREEVKGDEAEAVGETGLPPLKTAGVGKKPLADLAPAPPTEKGNVKTTMAGVKYETMIPGKGATSKAGDRVSIHYVGTLEDGRKFDSSRERGTPFSVQIGVGDVIRGWDEAIPGMKVGEVRRLVIPPNAGYGALGFGSTVPPNATLMFEVELIKIL